MALDEDEIDRFLVKASPLLDSEHFDRNRWFFGTSSSPNWTGYTIRFYVISDYLADNGETPAGLADVETRGVLGRE